MPLRNGSISWDVYLWIIIPECSEERTGFESVNIPGYSRTDQRFSEVNYDFLANVDKDISDNLNFKALLGGNLSRDNYQSIAAATNGGLIVPGIYSLANSINPIVAPTESAELTEVGGVFAGITLTYKDMLILDATARRDQSSTLPKDNNAYFYPSVSGGFVFSKLMSNANWLELW